MSHNHRVHLNFHPFGFLKGGYFLLYWLESEVACMATFLSTLRTFSEYVCHRDIGYGVLPVVWLPLVCHVYLSESRHGV